MVTNAIRGRRVRLVLGVERLGKNVNWMHILRQLLVQATRHVMRKRVA